MRLAISPELIEAARDPKGGGMERLLQMLWPHAFRIARSIVQNDWLAEDVAQEASAVVYREISRLRSADAFRVWVYRIVTREALRVAKRSVADPHLSDATYQADIDKRIDLLDALTQLAPELRAAIVLRYYAELNSSEIGNILGIPSPTVRFRLGRARQRLRQILSSDSCVTLVEVSQ